MNRQDPQELFEYREAMIECARCVGRRQPLDEADYMFYWKKLEDVNWPIVKAALDEVGKEMNYFPSVSTIREKCRKLIEQRRQDAYDSIIKTCDHGTGNWESYTDDQGVERMRKCPHFVAAMAAMENVGKRLAIGPPSGSTPTGE